MNERARAPAARPAPGRSPKTATKHPSHRGRPGGNASDAQALQRELTNKSVRKHVGNDVPTRILPSEPSVFSYDVRGAVDALMPGKAMPLHPDAARFLQSLLGTWFVGTIGVGKHLLFQLDDTVPSDQLIVVEQRSAGWSSLVLINRQRWLDENDPKLDTMASRLAWLARAVVRASQYFGLTEDSLRELNERRAKEETGKLEKKGLPEALATGRKLHVLDPEYSLHTIELVAEYRVRAGFDGGR